MQPSIDYPAVEDLFARVRDEGRDFLHEHETYSLLALSGSESAPSTRLLTRDMRPTDEELTSMPGDRVVLKIVHPHIMHKTEAGGVRVVHNQAEDIRSARRRMMDEVPPAFAEHALRNNLVPPCYADVPPDRLPEAAARDTVGVLMCRFMPPDSEAFGNELLVSLRRTREFGMIITAGLGGTDTELYADRFRKGQAVVSASVELTDAPVFFKLFRTTIAYRKLAGLTRGGTRIVSDDQLLECFASFIAMGRRFSSLNPSARFVIRELEVNPFAFSDYRMVPLDGLCSFSEPGEKLPEPRPLGKIRNLLKPETMAVMGVSSKRANFGRIILDNVIAAGFPENRLAVLKPGGGDIDGIPCFDDLEHLPHTVDLLVVAVGADKVPDIVTQALETGKARSLMLIPGGLGETEAGKHAAEKMEQGIDTARKSGADTPVFVGSNCLGIRSRPGGYDTIFIPKTKLAIRRQGFSAPSAFISQSGAFLVTRFNKIPQLNPEYLISIGNQTDLTAGDFLTHFQNADDVRVIAVYLEGFRDMDGLAFCRAVRRAVENGKDVIFYKAGRTPEGKSATSSHTASVAGDYMVCESCVRRAGAMVADSFTQFEDLYLLAGLFHGKQVDGTRIAAASGAGFEAVGMADSIQGDDYSLSMAKLASRTLETMRNLLSESRLDHLVNLANPLDMTPSADDRLHLRIARALIDDPGVDGLVLGLDPLSPAMRTLPEVEEFHPESIARLLPPFLETTPKPVVTVIDAGERYDPLARTLRRHGVPVFRSADPAVAALAKYMEGRIRREG